MRLEFRARHRRLAAVLAMLVTFAGSGIAAQEGALFQPLAPAAGSADEEAAALPTTTRIPMRGGDTVRHREMRVDFARLATVKETLESGKPATLDLNLFDDVAFRAVDLRIAPTSSGGYSLAGRLDGVRLGTATLVVSGEIVKGSVRTPSGTYTIDANADICHIRKVDPSSLAPLGEPLRPPPSMMSPRGPGRTASATARGVGTANDEDGSVTDVLVVYTPAARDAQGGVLAMHALVELFVAETNQAFTDSGVDQQVFLTRVGGVDYIESGDSSLDLNRLTDPSDGHMDIVHELREKTGSDLVHLIADVSDVCGIAWLMWRVTPLFEQRGFALTSYECGGVTFAHELGHNMGLRHDRYVDRGDTPYPYSHGYVNRATFEEGAPESSRWRTIMSYPHECRDAGFSCMELLRFSNAEQEYEGDPLGIAEGDEAADARRGLNDTRRIVAGFREAGPDLTAAPLIVNRAWEVGQTNILIIGIVTNEGRIESSGTTVTFYRSADPTIAADDLELASESVGPLVGKEMHSTTHVETAPDAGGYYYGLCVDKVEGETDTENCSAGVYVTVGPTVSVADAQTTEGESLAFSVSLSEPRDVPVDVEWELRRETAVAGLDYAGSSGKVTFAAGQTLTTISIETIADDIPEGDDTMAIALVGTTPAPPTGVVLSVDGTRATGTIRNDDGEPRFADPQLRAAVLRALYKPTDGEITVEDLAGLRVLDASGAEERIADLAGLEPATALQTLMLFNNAVRDLSPLGHLGELKALFLDGNGLRSLDALNALEGLTTLSLTGNPVADLSPLAGLTMLTRLWLDRTDVTDLRPLADLTSLEVLILEKQQSLDAADAGITDISALARLTNLTELNLNFNDVVDISALSGMNRLNNLDLWGNEIVDLEPLRALTSLFRMDLDDNEITEIEPLSGLASLNALHLNGNRVRDLAPLSGLRNLETLGLNANEVTDIGHLAGLTALRWLWLRENGISDLAPLAELDRLRLLDLDNNGITDVAPLADLFRLRTLRLRNNRIRDISPLADLRRLAYLDLSNNVVGDIEPLVSNRWLADGDVVRIQGNPLNESSIDVHVPALLGRGLDLTYVGVSVAAGSALEGSELEFGVRLSAEVTEDVSVNWWASNVSATAGADYPRDQFGTVTLAADSLDTTITVPTHEDAESETHEMIEVSVTSSGDLPDHVGLARTTALGLIVDPDGPSRDVPLFARASHETRQGFVRVINRGGRNAVHVVAADDSGNRRTTTLAMDVGETVHFNSDDLESGNIGKGLSRGIGTGEADWRLELSGNDVEVLTYMRTNDGFLTSLHDVVPAGADGYSVPIFNPGKNTNQESLLRLINSGDADAAVAISGVDTVGASSGTASLVLTAGEARTISAADLENGTGLEGALGTGSGKWRLSLASDQPIVVASLMQTPTGHLTNLSTTADNTESVTNATAHHVYLFPSASDARMRQGFVRVINPGSAGSVEIRAYDQTDNEYETVVLEMDAGETVHFNSDDLETGNPNKGLSGSTGAGEGDWRLVLTSALELDVLAYLRTDDGFLTGMHDTVPRTQGVHHVPIFNPGSNRSQVSLLRLVNTGHEAAAVTISGMDAVGRGSKGRVRLALPAGKVHTVSAQALEAGAEDMDGALGDGSGKWSLEVKSDVPIHVLSLLESPTGHLTNLSTWPATESMSP